MNFGNQTIKQFGFPSAARHAIEHQGIQTVEQLCLLDGTEILNWRKNGLGTTTEILQALLQRNIRPIWLKTVAMRLQRPSSLKAPDGWHRILAPCDKAESYILELTIADMERASVQWMLVEAEGGRELWRKGGVEMEDEL